MTVASVLSDVTNAHAMGTRTTAVRTPTFRPAIRRSAGVARMIFLSRHAARQPQIDEAEKQIDYEYDNRDHRRWRDVNGPESVDENLADPRARRSALPDS